jgi:hypothetical protein
VNTLHTNDYYTLRKKIWRQIVPRDSEERLP